ncbi:F-box and FNIP repeat-containing protein [Megavirus baoshan]|uniref:F-box and FNIP repeat-containing protein n=1 Tax=Megavirus baoshan TaxID=2496520 RepID=A0A8K1W6C4_9VIRU|nr:F-box and FNIP repeat-containing protein [Megavirus baoshan]UFX99924.1 F-box and FNIP repeat-containing protein [Megavirus baoshan]
MLPWPQRGWLEKALPSRLTHLTLKKSFYEENKNHINNNITILTYILFTISGQSIYIYLNKIDNYSANKAQ